VWVGLVMGVATLATYDLFLPGGLVETGLNPTGDIDVARTAAFTTLVLAQLVNAFSARSVLASAFHGLWVNPWLWAAVGFGVVAQVAVVHVPALQSAFSTTSLGLVDWAVCAALASLVLWSQEVVKFVLRTRRIGAPR
jgi:Ca2+-transporting ATPase